MNGMTPTTGMSDVHALSGAFAVDALDPVERAGFETHLAACASCRAEVASFHETSALIAETTAESPPASLRAGVLAGIREVRPLPPESPEAAPPPEPTVAKVLPLHRRVLPRLLATAAAIVLLAAGLLVWHPWQSSTTSIADQVLHAPDAVSATQHMAGGGEMTLVRSPSLKRAVLVAHDLPSPGAGKTYQLWLAQPGNGMVSAGLISDTSDETLLMGDAATATAAAVSVEPDTGSSHPTTDPVALFPFSAGGKGDA
jgi:anti-sigma-K factor RskA